MKRFGLALCIAASSVSAVHAGTLDKSRPDESPGTPQSWSAWGGTIGVRWNLDLLQNLGISLDAPSEKLPQQDLRRHEFFAMREAGGLQFNVRNGSLQNFSGGSLQMRGGYVLHLNGGSSLDLRNFSLRVRASDPKILDIVSGDGKVWFYSDRLMFELADGKATLAIRAADLRIAPALAERIGMPEVADWEIADLTLSTEVDIQGSNAQPDRVCSPYPWPKVAVPGVTDAIYQADLFMQNFSVQSVGCLNCTASGGTAAFAPSSTLRNNVNDGTLQATVGSDPLGTSAAPYTANVAWYGKFSGNNAPYGNDQHPYLIWNLYRISANGGIEQVGRSGVKHAFLTINSNCSDSCFDGHSLGRGCGDTYGVGNNDSPSDMGPRSEIIAATGQWGRCGSIFDLDCNGSSNSSGNDAWTQRMKTDGSQLVHTSGDGTSFLFESWYVARDDINIYNSMATESVNPQISGTQWSLTGATGYKLGAAIDRWVDPASPPANAKNSELSVVEGHTKLAVKATDNGDGTWRYDYAAMNLDFARAVTTGSEPNLKVVSNKGFDSFSVPLPADAVVSATHFSDGDLTTGNDWTVSTSDGQVTWTAPASGPTLDWGTLYSFSMTVNAAPQAGTGTLHVAQSGSPASYDLATLGPPAGTAPMPAAGLSPSSVALSVPVGGNANATLSLLDSGGVGTVLHYAVNVAPSSCASPAAVAWLSTSYAAGFIGQGWPAAKIAVVANSASLAAGTYSAQICLHSDDATQPLIAVPVTLNVGNGAPTAAVAPQGLDINIVANGHTSGTFAVGNSGAVGSTLHYTIDTAPSSCATPGPVNWLGRSPASGSVAQGAPAATITATIDATGLAAGSYSALVCVHSDDPAHAVIGVPVNLGVAVHTTNDVIFIDGFELNP